MTTETIDMVELHERDRAVLDALAEGRANPYLIREKTGLNKGDTNTVLNRLARAGLIEQVTRGLYEITDKGCEEIGVPATKQIDVQSLRDALEDAQRAHKQGDADSVEEALNRMGEILDESRT